jgi:hypothetical protein
MAPLPATAIEHTQCGAAGEHPLNHVDFAPGEGRIIDKRGIGDQVDLVEERFPPLWIDSNHTGRPSTMGFQEPLCTYGTLAIIARLLLLSPLFAMSSL